MKVKNMEKKTIYKKAQNVGTKYYKPAEYKYRGFYITAIYDCNKFMWMGHATFANKDKKLIPITFNGFDKTIKDIQEEIDNYYNQQKEVA